MSNPVIGIDLGSRNVKIAVMESDRIIELKKFETIAFYREYGRKIDGEFSVDFAKLGFQKIEQIVSTGYGRNTIDIKDAGKIPELKAHVLGAVFQTKINDFTLLDLGGQDSKVIKVRNGKMIDFQTNDKCAASTGRYLENMATALGISLDELSKHYNDPVELNATCAVFGESELVGKIVDGVSLSSLCAGVNYTILRRIKPMLLSLFSSKIVFTGGVAKNEAMCEILRQEMECEIVIPEHPQFNGAIGCCIQALTKKA